MFILQRRPRLKKKHHREESRREKNGENEHQVTTIFRRCYRFRYFDVPSLAAVAGQQASRIAHSYVQRRATITIHTRARDIDSCLPSIHPSAHSSFFPSLFSSVGPSEGACVWFSKSLHSTQYGVLSITLLIGWGLVAEHHLDLLEHERFLRIFDTLQRIFPRNSVVGSNNLLR